MKVSIDQIWVTSQTLVCRVVIWGQNDEWRQKRYCSVPLADIPEEEVLRLYGWYLDTQPEEDPHQTALF